MHKILTQLEQLFLSDRIEAHLIEEAQQPRLGEVGSLADSGFHICTVRPTN